MNLDDLKELRRQLDNAIALQESGTRCVTCGQNPNGTAMIGDFVIKRVRNFKIQVRPIFSQPPPVIDSQAGDRMNPNSPHRQFPKNSS